MENHGLDTQLLTRFLKKRFHDEKPMDVISVEVENAVPKGENVASIVYRVKMNFLTAAGRRKKFSIIVKTALKGDGVEKAMKDFPVFLIETRIYTTILPIMEGFMEEIGDKREKLWPDILGYQPQMIVFEDLTDKGHVGVNRLNCLDFNHSKLVVRNLARIHAMSKVLLERGLITADDKGRLLHVEPFMAKWWDCVLTVLPDAMDNKWGNEWKELATKLRNQKSVIMPKLYSIGYEYDKRFEVFNHGDPWTCNLLFKYMEYEDSLPVSVKFVDYPMTHLNSFIWDIVYFLITSTIPSVRRERLHEFFEAYQLSLEKNLNMFNYTGYIPTLDDVKSEWERVHFVQLAYFITHPIMTAETSNAFDLGKLATHPPHEVIEESVFTDGKAEKSIGEDLKNLAISGLI